MADIAGPLLVRAGLITQEQLLAAHQARRQTGATLTEQLVMMAALNEEALISFYKQRLLVPRVSWAELGKIAPRVIGKLPAELAGEFRVIPMDLDREQNLTLAMADPSDTHAIDEVGFFTGCFVMRAVAAPSAIAWALVHYYKINTPLLPRLAARFPGAPPQAVMSGARTLVSEELPAHRPPAAVVTPGPPPPAPPLPVPAPPVTPVVTGEIKARPSKQQAVIVPEAVPTEIAESASGAAIVMDRPPRRDSEPKVIISAEFEAPKPPPAEEEPLVLPRKAPKPKAEIIPDEFGEDTPLPQPVPMDITGQQFLLDVIEPPAPPPPPPTVSATAALTGALEALRFAQDRDAVTAALVAYMGRLFRRAAFFVVKKGELCGWLGTGAGVQTEELRASQFKLDQPSTLREIVRTRLPYRGPVSDAGSRDFLIDAMGGWAPDEVLAVPICLRDRVVGLLLGDTETEPAPDDHVRQIVAAAAAALETVLLAKKVGEP